MHGYPLYREIEVDCVCCNMPTWFNFKSASDHVVCKACLRHVGDTVGKLRLRDQDHRGLWASDVALLREQLSAERLGNAQKTAELEGQIRALNLVNEGLQSTVLDGFSKARRLMCKAFSAAGRSKLRMTSGMAHSGPAIARCESSGRSTGYTTNRTATRRCAPAGAATNRAR